MAKFPIGCYVDASLMSIVCYCDTPRCNGLSVSALASEYSSSSLKLVLKQRHRIGATSGVERVELKLAKKIYVGMIFRSAHVET